MLFANTLVTGLLSRRALVWLLVGFLTLQGISVSFSMAQGQAHVHLKPVSILVLEDGRRAGHLTSENTLSHEWWGHSHQTSLRHHHSLTDPTVVLEPDGAALTAADEGALTHDLAISAFVAVLMLAFWWAPANLSQQRAQRNLWQPSFVTARLLERPPQAA